MKRLKIIYKKKEQMHCEETEMRINFNEEIAELWIGTKEKSKLKELIGWITKELKNRTWLAQNEQLEISKFDKYVLEFEDTSNERLSNEVYSLCKMGYEAVQQGQTTWEYLIEELEESRCKENV